MLLKTSRSPNPKLLVARETILVYSLTNIELQKALIFILRKTSSFTCETIKLNVRVML